MKKLLLFSMACIVFVNSMAQNVDEMIIHFKDNTTKTFSLDDVDSITFNKQNLDPDQLNLSCNVDEITATNATYTISANQSNSTYYQFLMSEETYDNMIERYGSIRNHDKAWWEALAEYYEGTTWKDVMQAQLVTGTHSFNSADIIASLVPETNYIIYYYGLDSDNNQTTEIKETRFTTPKPQESSNTFQITNVTPNSGYVSFTVIPSNSDNYVVTAQSLAAVSKRLSDGMTMREVAQDFINVISNYGNIQDFVYSGQQDIELNTNQENTDYVIIVCGFDGGVTTEPATANFHSK